MIEFMPSLKNSNREVASYLCSLGFHEKLAFWLSRYLRANEDADFFLSDTIENLHSPFLLSDMQKAVARILQALDQDQKIMIHGDFDVDGLCASSVLYWGLRKAKKGFRPEVFIPDRFHDGHGISEKTKEKILAKKIDLVITADCGMGSVAIINELQKSGIDVIVTDHHIPEGELNCVAVVNPRLFSYPFEHLAGVGVAYKLIQALLEKKFGKNSSEYESTVENCIDYVAIGTVADVVPLLGENRILLRRGLLHMRFSKLPFLKDFWRQKCLRLDLGEDFTEEHIGWFMSPRLNAASRMESPVPALEFLLATDLDQVQRCGSYLDYLNQRRIELLQEMKEKSHRVWEFKELGLTLMDTASTQLGLLGLMAAWIADRSKGAAIVLGRTPDGRVSGSARSSGLLHLHRFLAGASDVLERFGGHAQAAGLGLVEEKIEEFAKKISSLDPVYLEEETRQSKAYYDIELSVDEVCEELVSQLEFLRPFGLGFEKPRIRLYGFSVENSRLVGRDRRNISFFLRGKKQNIQGISFGSADLLSRIQKSDSLVGTLGYNFFGSRKIQFVFEGFSV